MSEDNKDNKPNLVQVDFQTKQVKDEEKTTKFILQFLDKVREEVESGQVSQLIYTVENKDGQVYSVYTGSSKDPYRMLHVLEKIIPPQYQEIYLTEPEEEWDD